MPSSSLFKQFMPNAAKFLSESSEGEGGAAGENLLIGQPFIDDYGDESDESLDNPREENNNP